MYVILALLLLGVLIVIHEAGHFWAGRLCGIQVQEFSMGMGPQLLHWTSKKGTKFALRLLPIGGFCQFYGEDEEDSSPYAFENQAVWKRFVTVLCGPLMNFVIAILAIVIYLSCIGTQTIIPKIAQLEENAVQSGLMEGDTLLTVNGAGVTDISVITNALAEGNGAELTLTVERNGETLTVPVKPFWDEEAGRWRMGFTYSIVRERAGLLESIPFSVRYNIESVREILVTLRDLVFHGKGAEDVSGPVGTVYIVQEVTRQGGIDVYIPLLALISVNLGVMNLLPFPGLDGSRLLFLIVEAVRRKPVPRELEGKIHLAGLALLMALMLFLTYRDILKILTNGF